MPAVKQKQLALEKRLEKIYFNSQHPASLGEIEKLTKTTKLLPQEVKNWLSHQWAYTLHKPSKQKFSRRRYVTRGINEQWQADLVEMQHYSRINNGHRYILCVIDIFSRFAYARPLKSKTGPDVSEAMASILDSVET